jgi:hypothetical protein
MFDIFQMFNDDCGSHHLDSSESRPTEYARINSIKQHERAFVQQP